MSCQTANDLRAGTQCKQLGMLLHVAAHSCLQLGTDCKVTVTTARPLPGLSWWSPAGIIVWQVCFSCWSGFFLPNKLQWKRKFAFLNANIRFTTAILRSPGLWSWGLSWSFCSSAHPVVWAKSQQHRSIFAMPSFSCPGLLLLPCLSFQLHSQRASFCN